MKRISDFTEADRWVVETALKERYGAPVAVELADSEIKLDAAAAEITLCPTFYWEQRGVEFVIFKVAENRYRSQFIIRSPSNTAPTAISTTSRNA